MVVVAAFILSGEMSTKGRMGGRQEVEGKYELICPARSQALIVVLLYWEIHIHVRFSALYV
eukprot:1153977-Pelagomonas_calceolata.AAC.2